MEMRTWGFEPGAAVVITGAGSGIGLATARRAAELDLAVAAWDIDGGSAQRTASELQLSGASAYAHEVGIFLLLPLAVQLGLHVRSRRGRYGWWIAPTASLAIVGVATVVLWALITRLRAESLVGAYGEVGEYLSPSVEISRIRFYLRQMIDGPGLMGGGTTCSSR